MIPNGLNELMGSNHSGDMPRVVDRSRDGTDTRQEDSLKEGFITGIGRVKVGLYQGRLLITRGDEQVYYGVVRVNNGLISNDISVTLSGFTRPVTISKKELNTILASSSNS